MADEGVRAYAHSALEWWRSTRVLGAWLIAGLAAQAALNAVLAVVDDGDAWVRLHDALDVNNDVSNSRVSHALDGIQPWSSIFGYLSLAVLVLLIIWTFRSTSNARAAGRSGARWSPGWTIAGWLVPFLNFFIPYQAWSDLYRNSSPGAEPGDAWRERHSSSLVVGWWFLTLGGQLVISVATVTALIGNLSAGDAHPLLLSGHVAMAIGSALGALIVHRVTQWQEARQVSEPAPTRSDAPQRTAPTTVDGPGWYVDPGGRFDHRYWDGSGWTEHVSVGGVASTAPVVAPDWYPDPTGRFHWRYWTGHEWTEHVSRDQELFIDKLDA